MTKLLSKLINGKTQTSFVKLHASPVPTESSSDRSRDPSVASLDVITKNLSSAVKSLPPFKFPSLPTQLKPIVALSVPTLSIKFTQLSNDLTFRPFTGNITGLPDDKPVVVISSDFTPIYSEGGLNFEGRALQLKQTARTITAKTAITVITQSSGLLDQINANKEDLRSYISAEYNFLNTLVGATNSAVSSLNIFSYSPFWSSGFFTPQTAGPTNFSDLLRRNGYSAANVSNFSRTKLWQQNLIEIKKNFLTHTPSLISQDFSRNVSDDAEAYILSDVKSNKDAATRIWINPYGMESVSPVALIDRSTYYNNLQKLLSFFDSQFVNLSLANAPVTKLLSPSTSTITKSTLSPSDGSGDGIGIASNFLNVFSNTPRDVCILTNFLFKEMAYSKFLTNQSNVDYLSTKFGFSTRQDTDNMSVWDFIIGRFPESILDFTDQPVGNGNSLVSLSQHVVTAPESSYKILTFENNQVTDTSVTPGVFYYVDSTLSTRDGQTFDTARLDDLIAKTRSAQDTVKKIVQFVGFDYEELSGIEAINSYGARYTKNSQFSPEPIFNRLSLISSLYTRAIKVDSLGEIQLDTKGMVTYDRESTITRLAALICKVAVNPVASYRQSSKYLRAHLFMFIMNVVLKQVENYNNDDTIEEAKQKISNLLAEASADISIDDLNVATEERRNFPITVGNSPDVYSPVTDPSVSEIAQSWNAGLIYIDNRVKINEVGRVVEHPNFRASIEGEEFNREKQRVIGDTETVPTVAQTWQVLVNVEIDRWLNERRSELTSSRKRAYDIYTLGSKLRLFEVNENKGLWRLFVEEMRSIYTNQSLFDSDATIYSSLPKMAYMYVYFEMLLRVIASQTPDNLLGAYSGNRRYTERLENETFSNASVDFTLYETGLVIDKVTAEQLSEYYDKDLVGDPAYRSIDCCVQIRDAASIIRAEDESVINGPKMLRKYLVDLEFSLSNFKNYLVQNFGSHLERVGSLYTSDPQINESKRTSLLNRSFFQEQVKLSSYVMSEISERLSPDNDYVSKLRSTAEFASFPQGFEEFMPISDVSLISFRMLHPFFRSQEFLSAKGNNKRILSVGIPPKLIRKLRSDSGASTNNYLQTIKQGFIRVKVFKLNKLYPDIVYKPNVYIFDMNRYPTRALNNWDYGAFLTDTPDILRIPSKHIKISTAQGGGIDPVIVHRDFSSAFPVADFQDLLTEDEKVSMYRNHSTSFLLEEYLRWFTDCSFDESRYNNFGSIDADMSVINNQYGKFVDSATQTSLAQAGALPRGNNTVIGTFKNFSNQTIEIPIQRPQNSQQQTSASPQRIQIGNTIRSYFINETLLLDTSVLKRRMSYPKKFDRVFSLIIDPDDFIVDETMSTQTTLNYLRADGIIVGGELIQVGGLAQTSPYRHRDTTPQDVTLDEYFVTVEPFDYVEEYE